MTKRRGFLVGLLVLMLLSATAAFAQGPLPWPVDEDVSVYSNDGNLTQNAEHLRVEAGDPTCRPSRWSYLKWDLTQVPAGKLIGDARITLYVNLVNGDSGQARLTLYSVADDSWSETTVTSASGPALGTALQSVAVPPQDSTVVFEGDAVLDYLNQQRSGDGVASFALQLTGNCGNASVLVRMYSKDLVPAVQQSASDERPLLYLWDPSAVDISSFVAGADGGAWTLYLILAALALIVVAGARFSRRRVLPR